MQFEDVMKLILGKSKNKTGGEPDNSENSEAVAEKQPKSKGNWRKHLDSCMHCEINRIVKGTHNHKYAYKRTLNVRNAQLWVALAQMSQRVSELEIQLGVKSSEEVPVEVEEQTVEEKIIEEPQKSSQMIISGQPAASIEQQVPLEQS
jgi:hypothetical protein